MNKSALIIIQNLSFPLDRRVYREGVHLKDNGFSVSIISPTGKNQDKKLYENIDGIKVYRFPLATDIGGKYYYFIEYLWSFLAIFFLTLCALPKVQYVQVCNPPDIFFPIGWLCHLFNRKFIFDHHDLCPELYLMKFKSTDKSNKLYKLLLWFEGMTAKTADKIISVNENYKRIVSKRHNVDLKKFIVSRNLPNPKDFRRVESNEKLKKGKEYLITYHGVMGEADSVEVILYSAKELKNKGLNNFYISIIGDGPTRKELMDKSIALNLDDCIDFPGRVSNKLLLEYLSTSSIGLLPDKNNPFNNVSSMNKTVEYITIGLPFIAFDLKETMDTAGDGALYATNNDIQSFAGLIEKFIKEKGLRDLLTEKVKSKQNDFIYSKVMDDYLEAFK